MSEITLEKLRDNSYSEILHMLLNDKADGMGVGGYIFENNMTVTYLMRYAVTMILKFADDPEMMNFTRDSIIENLEDAAARVIKKTGVKNGNARD